MSEHIVYIPEDMKDGDELFVGNLRKDRELIRCEDCEYFKPMSIYGHGLCDVHCNGEGKPEVVSETYYCCWADRRENGRKQ